MRKFTAAILLAVLLSVFSSVQAFALTGQETQAIQTLLDEACRISGTPGMSVSITTGGETSCFSSGYANKAEGTMADETTLYELASVSKAFTGAAVLLLEEQGLISMSDPVQKYLPWLTFKYNGNSVDMSVMTLNNFLFHTSGLSNRKHFSAIPQGDGPDMLKRTVEALADAELAFQPGYRHEYGTVNYDVLGLIIETVAGQSYEDFMTEQVFKPLGLNDTYLYASDAKAAGRMAQGYRTSFMITTAYNAPDYGGNKPAGYIISSVSDMARWNGIHLGAVTDIPDVFKTVIEKAHIADTTVPAVGGMHYAAGWYASDDGTEFFHSGGNPAFAAFTAFYPDEQTGICLLSNSAGTNTDIVGKIKKILDGDYNQTYTRSFTQLSDVILTAVTLGFLLLSALLVVLGLRRKASGQRKMNGSAAVFVGGSLTLAVGGLCFMFPSAFGYDWPTALVWENLSMITAMVSLVIFIASVTLFVYIRRLYMKRSF